MTKKNNKILRIKLAFSKKFIETGVSSSVTAWKVIKLILGAIICIIKTPKYLYFAKNVFIPFLSSNNPINLKPIKELIVAIIPQR